MDVTNHDNVIERAMENIAQAVDMALSLKLDPHASPSPGLLQQFSELEKLLGDAHYSLHFINDALERRLKQDAAG